MPPYSQKPPKSKGLVVQVPICKWCKERVGYKCRGCERITCNYCLTSFEGGKCVHQVYNPVQSTGWGDECPNPHCDVECNVCMGKGYIWSPLQRQLYSPK